MLLRPVFQSKIHRPGTEITAADTDLHDCRKFLSRSVGNLTAVHLFGKLGDALLLLYIKFSLIYAIRLDSFAQLTAGQMMKHQTVLAGVDDRSVVKLLKFLRQLRLVSQLCQRVDDFIVHLLCRVVVGQSLRHGDAVRSHALRAALP